MGKEPTQEQMEVLGYSGNIVVTAKPGSGKTFTVVEKNCEYYAIIAGLSGRHSNFIHE